MPRELALVAEGPYGKLIRVVREVSRAPDGPTGLRRGLECAAGAVGADVAALLRSRSVLAAVRVSPGPVPEAGVLLALADPTPGPLFLPGVGACRTAVVPNDRAPGRLLVIRSGGTPFTDPDIGLLTAMAETLTLAARMLEAVDGDRESLSERHRLLERLTRIQRWWGGRGSLEEALDAVTAGAALLAFAVAPKDLGWPLLAVAALGGGSFAPLLLTAPLEMPRAAHRCREA